MVWRGVKWGSRRLLESTKSLLSRRGKVRGRKRGGSNQRHKKGRGVLDRGRRMKEQTKRLEREEHEDKGGVQSDKVES